MKTGKEILNHILSPYHDKLNHHRCLKKIISLLPLIYQKYINSITTKGSNLYIFVNHPAIKQELYFKRKEIFSIINTLNKLENCNLNITKIYTIYKYTPAIKPPKELKFYIKKVNDFKIKAKNEKIRKKFEEIKEALRASYQ